MAANQSQPPLPASARVANIPELLEKILLRLASNESEGLRTLLLSQRTCHAFRDQITGAPSLRRALGFEQTFLSAPGCPELNPLFQDSDEQPINLADGTSLEVTVDWRKIFDDFHVRPITTSEHSVRITRYADDGAKYRESNAKTSYMKTHGSWRQIRIFQETGGPKVTELERGCVNAVGNVFVEDCVYGEWENPTLGEVFDLLYYKEHAKPLAT
ncbi:uncharacterized protein MYCFIDRAFT_78361 [Pseudocercospora fijiensis CIRAD86]|uniref:F-box domain-containing protein n=1 Tax=Pseudocercospora fijiensis (strain CIRAD86) TaxID=383855 RepID=M3AMG3_PSEFD|nr:uncharacterized protein MYCFIDRAFT_78361 [Pseudocercospora fijiensis CIRAD86]EME78652.1 hypothetical protein MYCFIDRAFT_78361 [Pseudocercospora fijiensis CIRAD86]